MNDIVSLVVPAVAALAGVALAQAWGGAQARTQSRLHLRHQLWQDRRAALLRYLVAMNHAYDGTRMRVGELSDEAGWSAEPGVWVAGEHPRDHPERSGLPTTDDRWDQAFHPRWAAAFEAFLELEIVLPDRATEVARRHIDASFAWRRRCLRSGEVRPAPGHAELVGALGPWLGRSATDLRVPG